jgi:hypothetical protein
MDYLQQQKSQIDEDARKAKVEIDRVAVEARQALADEESARVKKDAEEEVSRIQNDAQK